MILTVEKKLCKQCSEIKTCILVGKFDHKNKKYTDETGSYWNGKLCPTCNRGRVKEVMRGKRKALKESSAGQDLIQALTEVVESQVKHD